jgi:cytochrome c peroxidase
MKRLNLRITLALMLGAVMLFCLSFAGGLIASDLSPIELLGKYVFFDKISSPKRMACITCHDPATGGTGSVSGVNLHQVAITGANPHTVGSLKPPTNAYASFIEPLFTGCPDGIFGICGGNFWNGRAEGNELAVFPGATKHIGEEIFYSTDGMPLGGDVSAYAEYFGPTADQALNPPPNPVEQNINRKAVCQHVASAEYAELYEDVWGVEIDCSDSPVTVCASDVDEERASDISFKRRMVAVCAWQASCDLNSFSSKRDKALQNDADGQFPLDDLAGQENLGHDLFYGIISDLNPDGKDAGCSSCHSDDPRNDNGAEEFQLYADDGYHNIGTPRNPEIPDTGVDSDLGLMGLTDDLAHRGFFKTPTLRNVDKRKDKDFIKAYTHNGWFKSLESIVHFYNTALLGREDLEEQTGQSLPFVKHYEDTTAFKFGVTRCPEDTTEKDALKNNCWPAAAYSGGFPAIPFLLGDLGLTLEQEAALVAYMKTLTDEHTPKPPKPYKRNKR